MAKKQENWKDRLGTVFSTDPGFEYKYDEGGEETDIAKKEQNLRVLLDRKNRKGKAVTLVSGFLGPDEQLNALAKFLKQKCGVGGSAKDGEILIQGDHRNRVLELLIAEGYSQTKRSGG